MLHTIGRCLVGGKFKEYTETVSEWKVIKVKCGDVCSLRFVHFQAVPLVWARDEWCSYRYLNECDADTCCDSTELIDNKPVCLTTFKVKVPRLSLKWNVTFWRVCFGIFTGFRSCVDCSLGSFKLLPMNQIPESTKIWNLLCPHSFEVRKDETMNKQVLSLIFLSNDQ